MPVLPTETLHLILLDKCNSPQSLIHSCSDIQSKENVDVGLDLIHQHVRLLEVFYTYTIRVEILCTGTYIYTVYTALGDLSQ